MINIKPYLSRFREWEEIYVVINYNSEQNDKLLNIWFTEILEGNSIIPFFNGNATLRNSDGFEVVRKDLPKEQYIHELPYSIEWYDGRIYSWVNYFPKLRYQRELQEKMWVWITITEKNWVLMIVSDPIKVSSISEFKVKNTVNMFLEIFWEPNIVNENFTIFGSWKIRRFNFEFIKKWKYPWDKIKESIYNPVSKTYKPMAKKVILDRWDNIHKYVPDFIWTWKAGFRGYVCFWFEWKNMFFLESSLLGNATYVFDENWEDISQLTKAEILKWKLQKYRIIHWPSWESEINRLLW